MMNKLPAWERLFKRLLWEQLGEVKGKRILDLGSGAGVTADFGAIHYMDGDLVARRQAGFRVAEHYGIRSFWHLQQRQEKHDDEAWQEAMMALERRVQEIPTYRDIAFFHHLIYVKDD